MKRTIKYEQDIVGHAEPNHESFHKFYRGKLIISLPKSDPERYESKIAEHVCPFCGSKEVQVRRIDAWYNRCWWCMNEDCSYGTDMTQVPTWAEMTSRPKKKIIKFIPDPWSCEEPGKQELFDKFFYGGSVEN